MEHTHRTFRLSNFKLQSGEIIDELTLVYTTYGKLNHIKDNVIIYPTWFAGRHSDNEWLIGKGKALDPEHYFIIIPNMFGNGLSSSPSNMPQPYQGSAFPKVTIYDNVYVQQKLVTEVFGVKTIRLITGWSLAAMQAYHWAAAFPDMVEKIAPFGGAAKCSNRFALIIESAKTALKTDKSWNNGYYTRQPEEGIKAMARVYAPWAYSDEYIDDELYLKYPEIPSLEIFIQKRWENAFLHYDANDLLCMLETGQHGNIGHHEKYKGDFIKALKIIQARALVMPGETDLLFPVKDSQLEVSLMSNAKLVVIPSKWGHESGIGANPEDNHFIDRELKKFLAE